MSGIACISYSIRYTGRNKTVAYLILVAIFFMAVSVAAAVKGDWTVWVIATVAMFYFIDQIKEE